MADNTGFAGAGLLDEHAPKGDTGADRSGDTATYNPTDDEKRALKLAEKVFERNKKHRAQYDQKWLDYYHMFRGKQWKEQRPSYRHSEVINLIFRSLQSNVPIQLDTKPKLEFLPEKPTDAELAQILNQVIESDWSKGNWSESLLEVVWDSNLYGTGLSSMLVKQTLGTNNVVYASADPFYSFPDPEARDVNKDGSTFGYSEQAPSFVYAEPMDVRKIKKKYPKVKEFIKADLQDMTKGSKTNTQPMKFRSPIDNKVIIEGSSAMDLVDKEKALLVTCYLSAEYCEEDFDEVEKKGEINPDTGIEAPPEYIQKAKYPNGRKIVYCNGVLCDDVDNGYDDAQFPFDRYANYTLPREFWGMSEVEQLEGPQKTFNKIVSFALDTLTLMGNPIWLIPSSSGIDVENMVNRPGLQVEYDNGQEGKPERLEGVGLQPYVMQLIDKMAEWFDSVAGSQDITRGAQPTGVTAASAISSLQEAAQTRIRGKTHNLDYYLQGVGQKYLSRVFQFKTAPEVYRLTGQDGATKYFQMHVESYEHPDGLPAHKVHYQPFTADGQIDPTQAKIYETRAKFDCKVSTGSNLPFAKDQLDNKLFALFDRGIIDNEEVLKRQDYPNYQSILQRMQQVAQQQQAAAAAQKPPAKGGAAPPPAA